MRVLIIDDDPDLRSLLGHYIKQRWQDAAVDEWDPLERDVPGADFPLGSYQALILDYMLGRGDGLEWLAKLKQRSDCPKVLFLTGAGNESIAVRAMKAGADDYQRKQELTRERLLTSLHDLTAAEGERTVSRELAARMEAHSLGAKVRIPGIKVLRLIGEGGMARVYLAAREGEDVPLVVKILRREVLKNKTALQRFMEEYALVERIQSRHVARIYDHGQSEEHAYLVMEFFEGGDLMKRLAGTALEPGEALRIFRELMFALGDIHEKGILHRDLKPQNLMFRQDGTLAILDFGIAKHIDAIDRTKEGEVLGTPRYMSPEQVQGRALDLRTDIYSAGVLLYQMLTGEHLFEGETAVEVALHHLNTPPPALPEHLQTYQRLLDKLLEKDREARFRNADEVIGFLARKLEGSIPDDTQRLH
ncbi:MAG TPA: protein kinase [Burkholderiales bacterium]|jgi:DNA-binding response OmpR family regulator|nr:protein kinase [Burkholderiales bacterium]